MEELAVLNVKMGGYIETAGTFRVARLPDDTGYKDIIRVFGKPQYIDPEDDQFKAEWSGTINGRPFTIYDFKTGKSLGSNTTWSIGGHDGSIGTMILEYFENNLYREGVKKETNTLRVN